MTDQAVSPRILAVPKAESAHYEKNFIRQAVCELRFPTLFELEQPRPPVKFAQALRKEFPVYEAFQDLNVSAGGVAQAYGHSFAAKKGRWKVTLRASSIILETLRYDSYEEFESHLKLVVNAAEKVIDSDFFTRVGLRYINSVWFGNDDVSEWVNPVLVGVLASGLYGDVQQHHQQVTGLTDVGGYTFQHGIGFDQQTRRREYVLDFDFFKEDVFVDETIEISRKLHELEFSMFCWSLGEKAKQHLSATTKTKG